MRDRILFAMAACLATMTAFATPIRLGSWNIRLATMDKWEKDPRFPKWEARMPHVTGLIEEKGFDLMGLQEVCSQQADFIRRAMPDWGLVGVATNDVERGDTGHANGVFYRKDRFKVVDWGWFAISEMPNVPGSKSWNTMCIRSCTWALMEDTKDSLRFFLFNTHFDHRSQEAREKGMALVLAEIRARNKAKLPVMLMGDFNSRVESPQIQLAKKTMSRAYEISETPPTGPFRTDNCWRFVPPEKEDAKAGNRIDHIFLTPGTRVISHETFGDFYGDNFYPSDHFPMKAVIELTSGTTFAEYDNVSEVKVIELKRTSQSWDGAELPDYPAGRPELVVKRYIFPCGSKLGWHHHPVMNFGIVQQGELTIIGLDGKEKTVHAGEAVVEMVGTIHHGENRGDKPVVLDMHYVSQKGTPLAVQHPEIRAPE